MQKPGAPQRADSPSAGRRNAGEGLTIVIKVGTSSLVRGEQRAVNISNLARICETVRGLHDRGHRVVLVSSGAIGVGAVRFGLEARPKDLAQRQALAAVGQVHLMRFYEDFLAALGLTCAQVLLTLDNLAQRGQYRNASNTFAELFNYGCVPVVNENDTVAVEEIRIGDNDTLSAQVATLVRADWLFLLTDVPYLYTANPSTDPSAVPIREVRDIALLNVDTSTAGTAWGTGGMATKLTAARLATAAGCHMAICQAAEPENVVRIVNGEPLGTVFYPHPHALRGRKRWILSVPIKGEIRMDAGAVRAVRERSKSLFAPGIRAVAGDFSAQDCVRLCGEDGQEWGRGLCNYSRAEVDRIKGMRTPDVAVELGYQGSEEIVHRDNLCLLVVQQRSRVPLDGGLRGREYDEQAWATSSQEDLRRAGAGEARSEGEDEGAHLPPEVPFLGPERDEISHRLAVLMQREGRGQHFPTPAQRPDALAQLRAGLDQPSPAGGQGAGPAQQAGSGQPSAQQAQHSDPLAGRLQQLQEREAGQGGGAGEGSFASWRARLADAMASEGAQGTDGPGQSGHDR